MYGVSQQQDDEWWFIYFSYWVNQLYSIYISSSQKSLDVTIEALNHTEVELHCYFTSIRILNKRFGPHSKIEACGANQMTDILHYDNQCNSRDREAYEGNWLFDRIACTWTIFTNHFMRHRYISLSNDDGSIPSRFFNFVHCHLMTFGDTLFITRINRLKQTLSSWRWLKFTPQAFKFP